MATQLAPDDQISPSLGETPRLAGAHVWTAAAYDYTGVLRILGDEHQIRPRAEDSDQGPDSGELQSLTFEVQLAIAWLRGLTFEDAATVTGLEPSLLRATLHGPTKPIKIDAERVEAVLQILRRLRSLFEDDAVGKWFKLSVPALGDRTPLDAVKNGEIDRVRQVVESYFDPSYS